MISDYVEVKMKKVLFLQERKWRNLCTFAADTAYEIHDDLYAKYVNVQRVAIDLPKGYEGEVHPDPRPADQVRQLKPRSKAQSDEVERTKAAEKRGEAPAAPPEVPDFLKIDEPAPTPAETPSGDVQSVETAPEPPKPPVLKAKAKKARKPVEDDES